MIWWYESFYFWTNVVIPSLIWKYFQLAIPADLIFIHFNLILHPIFHYHLHHTSFHLFKIIHKFKINFNKTKFISDNLDLQWEIKLLLTINYNYKRSAFSIRLKTKDILAIHQHWFLLIIANKKQRFKKCKIFKVH